MEARVVLQWAFWLSLITFFGSLVVLVIVIIRMPADYFVRDSSSPDSWRIRHPLLVLTALIAKNLLGLFLAVAGVIMIVTPGQGVLAILVGISLMDIPGKKAWERRIVIRRPVHRALNSIRRRAGRPPLQVPGPDSLDGPL